MSKKSPTKIIIDEVAKSQKTGEDVIVESLFKSSESWVSEICHAQPEEKRQWALTNGAIKALKWKTGNIPRAGLSMLIREDDQELTCRVGMNLYVENPKIPDASFAVLLSRQQDFGFIGGVIELFPAVRVDMDIKNFRNRMENLAQIHGQDYAELSKGLTRAFVPKGTGKNLGAEAGFNFYRAGLELTEKNVLFAKEAFVSALDGFKDIFVRAKDEFAVEDLKIKKMCWQKHLQFMKEDDIGIKMSLEQGIPMDFFSFSTFPPA